MSELPDVAESFLKLKSSHNPLRVLIVPWKKKKSLVDQCYVLGMPSSTCTFISLLYCIQFKKR